MSTYQWLLAVHLVAAFLFLSGAVAAGLLELAALRCRKPSEVATVLRLARPTAVVVSVGALIALAGGIALAEHIDYGLGHGWLIASIVLWLVSMGLGGAGGRQARQTRELAERLAAAGDAPSDELDRALRDPVARALEYLSLAAGFAILVLMVWKPGA